MPQDFTPRQRQTASGRAALAAKFADSDSKSKYYRELGAKGNANRIVLPAAERDAFIEALKVTQESIHGLQGLTRILGQLAARLEREGDPGGTSPEAA
jgi:hypothetical protein